MRQARLIIAGWGEQIVYWPAGARFQTTLELWDATFVHLIFKPWHVVTEEEGDPCPMYLDDVIVERPPRGEKE
jgi:hypothetical protein